MLHILKIVASGGKWGELGELLLYVVLYHLVTTYL